MFAPTACAAPRSPLLLVLVAVGRDAAARVGLRRPVGRVDAERAHALRTGPSGRFLLDGHVALPPRPRGRRPAQRLAAPDGHRRLEPRDRPERLERDGQSRGLVRRRRRLVPPATSACPSARRGPAWVVRFESVNYRSQIWLNGHPIGANTGAYLPFEVTLPASALHRGGTTAWSSASTAAGGGPTSRPRACRCAGRRSAAGGTTAGSCARSTSVASTGATSPRCRSSRTSAARPARRGWTTACGSATSAATARRFTVRGRLGGRRFAVGSATIAPGRAATVRRAVRVPPPAAVVAVVAVPLRRPARRSPRAAGRCSATR